MNEFGFSMSDWDSLNEDLACYVAVREWFRWYRSLPLPAMLYANAIVPNEEVCMNFKIVFPINIRGNYPLATDIQTSRQDVHVIW